MDRNCTPLFVDWGNDWFNKDLQLKYQECTTYNAFNHSTSYIFYLCASILCVTLLGTTWALLPKWRTLQAYISLNELTAWTIAMFFSEEMINIYKYLLGYSYFDGCPTYIRNTGVFRDFLCLSFYWSMCAIVMAYIKLVKISIPINHEKVLVTAYTLGSFALVKVTSIGLDYFHIPPYEIFLQLVAVILLFINVIMYVLICVRVMSCCGKSMSVRGFSHVISLVGVGLVSQAMIVIPFILWLMELAIESTSWILKLGSVMFNLRIVPPTIVLLFNRRSRELWKKYFQQRRNRINNNYPLV